MAGFRKKYSDPTPIKAEFATSFSKIKNFETCARRYYTVDIMKKVTDSSAALDRGNKLHDAMKQRVQSDTSLPREFAYMEKWAKPLIEVLHPLQIIQCELQLACTRDMKSCGYWEKKVFMRSKIDYLRLIPGSRAQTFLCQIIDYKTGKPKDEDTQLVINAACVFAHYPDVIGVKSEFLYTEYGDTRSFTYTRPTVQLLWKEDIIPRVNKMEESHAAQNFPPNPCGLCREYCPVVSCEYHGKGKPR
jgi:hypothetical protein